MDKTKTCLIESCNRKTAGRGLCRKHYMRWWRRGTTSLPRKPLCKHPPCPRVAIAKGHCGKHRSRFKKHGTAYSQITKGCKIPGCNRKHSGRGLCNTHYLRWYRGGNLSEPKPLPVNPNTPIPVYTPFAGVSRDNL